MILVENAGISYIIDEKKLKEFENKGFKRIIDEKEKPQVEPEAEIIKEVAKPQVINARGRKKLS